MHRDRHLNRGGRQTDAYNVSSDDRIYIIDLV
jgi:hypothetical protein